MAAARPQEASSSTFRCSYHVFLSFRGEDTRKTFTDHLYTALVHAGIRTFRDDDELERGENIERELQKAIQESHISVIVFSKDYASSRWCLDELLKIVERKKTVNHKILPIFYHVNPSHVRKQTGSFAKAFAKHEQKCKAQMGETEKQGMAKVEKWTTALKEVADLAGMVLEDGHKSKFIQNIVKEIGRKLNRTVLSVPRYPVGMESHVKNINLWVRDGSNNVEILMICGMGGVGKTTIAKTIYNQNFDRFEGSSFLANIREISEQSNGLVCLQKLLLSDILKGRKVKIGCVDEGVMKIRDAIGCQRVLVVLDDIDHVDQLNAIVTMQDWFYPGSKIIITTRHEQLLKPRGLYKVYKVKELSDDDSFKLFSWHAFGQSDPIDGYMEPSKRVVHYCGGLPLALEVLGCFLFGRSVDVWESALKKLEKIPDTQILRKLKISYDSLDDHDQNLFLDIACFLIRKNEDYVIMILDGCDFCTKVGIQNLVDRCLLTIDKDKRLKMHQLLQDMGREIVRQESPREPGKRSRLWHHKDSLNVLRENTGTETIEGLTLNLTKENKFGEASFSVTNSKRNSTDAFQDKSTLADRNIASKRRRVGFFSWLPINPDLSTLCSASNEVVLPTGVFSRMHKLRLLQLNNVQLTGGFAEFPKRLRWLCWHGSTLKSIPCEFPLESLVALDMRNSCLEQVWKGTKVLGLLKILNLSYSHGLTHTPAFSELPNLERLILKYCTSLTEVHESIGELGRLVSLNLKGCKKLRKLPRQICFLKCLEKLILSGCSSLDELPTELGNMVSLAVLHADGTAINQTPSTTREVKSWSSFFRSSILGPKTTPKSINFSLSSFTSSLKSLSLANCNLSDDAIPEGLGNLSSLHQLNLRGNPICSLPESIRGLTMLESLGLDYCTKLQSLPELPISLTELELYNCRSLQRVANLPNLFRSLDLTVNGCAKLVEAQGLFQLEPLKNMDAEVVNYLRLFNMKFIGDVEVEMFNAMTLTKRKVPLQALYECGIFSTFIPGTEVPSFFSYKSMESLMCINVPSLPNLKVQGLNICVAYTRDIGHSKNIRTEYWNECYIKISNKTKDLKWTYSPAFVGSPRANEDMMWLSHWKIGNQLEGGNEVNISVFLWESLLLKWFGVQFLYDEQELEGTPHSNYPLNINVGDLSAYQAKAGSFFLCNHDFDLHQGCSTDDNWISKGWYDFLFGDSAEITGMAPVSPRYM